MFVMRLAGWVCLIGILGCNTATVTQEGSEQAARDYYAAEFQKWVANQTTTVSTLKARLARRKPPVGHRVLAVVKVPADVLSGINSEKPFEVYARWPTYKFTVEIEFLSAQGSPEKIVAIYTLSWDDEGKEWWVYELPNS